jgi:hypothetical protein
MRSSGGLNPVNAAARSVVSVDRVLVMNTRGRLTSAAFAAAALTLLMMLTACADLSGAGTPSPNPTEKSFEQNARDALKHLIGVAEVKVLGSPSDQSAGGAGVVVVMSGTASEEQAVAIAQATRKFAEDNSGDEPVEATLVILGPPAEDSTSPDAVQFEVFPKPWKSAARAAHAVMAIRQIPGVASIAIAGGRFPSIQVSDVSVLDDVLSRVRALELWNDGGDIRTIDGRVRITDLPGQLSHSTIGATIDQASRYGDGQFWIEAPKAGPTAPTLYVDHVTIEESHAIETAFLNTELEPGDQKTYPVRFSIRAVGPDGNVDTSGLFPGART